MSQGCIAMSRALVLKRFSLRIPFRNSLRTEDPPLGKHHSHYHCRQDPLTGVKIRVWKFEEKYKVSPPSCLITTKGR